MIFQAGKKEFKFPRFSVMAQIFDHSQRITPLEGNSLKVVTNWYCANLDCFCAIIRLCWPEIPEDPAEAEAFLIGEGFTLDEIAQMATDIMRAFQTRLSSAFQKKVDDKANFSEAQRETST